MPSTNTLLMIMHKNTCMAYYCTISITVTTTTCYVPVKFSRKAILGESVTICEIVRI